MAEATYDNFENDYAEAAELNRQKRIDQLKDDAEEEKRQKKNLSTRVKGAFAKIGKKSGDGEDEDESKVKAVVSGGAKMATGAGLRWSWYYLLPSWGLTIITLNLFAFLGLILHDAFPRVGEEWPKINIFGHKVIEKMAFYLIDVVIIIVIIMLFQLFVSSDLNGLEVFTEDTAGA